MGWITDGLLLWQIEQQAVPLSTMKAFLQGGGFRLKSKTKNNKDVWERREITTFYLFKIAYITFNCMHIHTYFLNGTDAYSDSTS